MVVNISKKDAEQTLQKAFKNKSLKSDKICKQIETVLKGSHKTYKYVLITGLLAKATNSKANALALQAGAPIDAAYDARSLCHQVVVPFERDYLQNALGGSNEPFLNKPARFTHLSASNAVRNGNDRDTLQTLIGILNFINNSNDPLEYLSFALEILSTRGLELQELNNCDIKHDPTLVEISNYINLFIKESFEGETCAMIVGTLEKLYYKQLGSEYRVVSHKVNQSGASSKETGDIDIYRNNDLIYSIEVKDKDFTVYDLEHAFNKIIKSNGKKGQFIFGPRTNFNKEEIQSKIIDYENNGFYVLFCHIRLYCRYMLFRIELKNKDVFIKSLIETANEINCKEETKRRIHNLLIELNWK